VSRGLTARRTRAALAALAAAGVALVALLAAGPAGSARPTVTLSGRAYVFNHAETGIAGATIRVRERSGQSAVTDAAGDYELEVPADADITPYIEPPPGYNQIDLQTFHTRGRDLENVNFQTPADAEYNGLAALLGLPFGPDGRPEQCVIVTTASARNVRGVDFETFRERTPHGVAGATARAKPGLPAAIYFNDDVIPDPSRTETSGDGGIIWTGVPAGAYRVIVESPSASFASFLATCEAGRIVNANPPWGAYELTGDERPLRASVVAGRVSAVGRGHEAGRRLVTVHVRAAERLRAKLTLRRGRKLAARKRTTTFRAPADKLPLRVSPEAAAGRAELKVSLMDAAGDEVTEKFAVRIPAD
jgi:hypothetical protein